MERLCSRPSWISARVQSDSRKGPERPVGPPDPGRDGETVSPSPQFDSQTSAGIASCCQYTPDPQGLRDLATFHGDRGQARELLTRRRLKSAFHDAGRWHPRCRWPWRFCTPLVAAGPQATSRRAHGIGGGCHHPIELVGLANPTEAKRLASTVSPGSWRNALHRGCAPGSRSTHAASSISRP